jgi:hypothetical protein
MDLHPWIKNMFIKSSLRKTVFESTIDRLFSYLCFVVLDWFDDSLSKRTNYSRTNNFGGDPKGIFLFWSINVSDVLRLMWVVVPRTVADASRHCDHRSIRRQMLLAPRPRGRLPPPPPHLACHQFPQ